MKMASIVRFSFEGNPKYLFDSILPSLVQNGIRAKKIAIPRGQCSIPLFKFDNCRISLWLKPGKSECKISLIYHKEDILKGNVIGRPSIDGEAL